MLMTPLPAYRRLSASTRAWLGPTARCPAHHVGHAPRSVAHRRPFALSAWAFGEQNRACGTRFQWFVGTRPRREPATSRRVVPGAARGDDRRGTDDPAAELPARRRSHPGPDECRHEARRRHDDAVVAFEVDDVDSFSHSGWSVCVTDEPTCGISGFRSRFGKPIAVTPSSRCRPNSSPAAASRLRLEPRHARARGCP